MLVVPENVHTGSPPFLKCGLAAKATDTVSTSMSSAVNNAIPYFTRRMVNLLSKFNANTDCHNRTYTFLSTPRTTRLLSTEESSMHPETPLQSGWSGSLANNFCRATRPRQEMLLPL